MWGASSLINLYFRQREGRVGEKCQSESKAVSSPVLLIQNLERPEKGYRNGQNHSNAGKLSFSKQSRRCCGEKKPEVEKEVGGSGKTGASSY